VPLPPDQVGLFFHLKEKVGSRGQGKEAYASRKELKQTKMEIMRRYHPDKNRGSDKEMNEICGVANKVFEKLMKRCFI